MSNAKQILQKKMNIILFGAGLLAVLLMGLPYLLLGQDAIVTYHDQLDGELIAYLLHAKYLFRGDVLPEFMNGAYKTALIPPAPAFVLFFLGGNGFWSLVCMQLLGSLCGYVGMYLLIKYAAGYIEGNRGYESIVSAVAVAIGVMYAYLPFLPVYGLAQYGLPLLLWLVLQVKSGKFVRTAYVYATVYALSSSLVLVGFGVLGVLVLWMLYLKLKEWRKCKENGAPKLYSRHMLGMWLVMLCLYVIENLPLLKQTLGIGEQGEVLSHKAEYLLNPTFFFGGLVQGFTQGGQHSGDYHAIFLPIVIGVLLIGILFKANKRLIATILTALGCNLGFALVAALWDSALGIALRTEMSALGAFQMNRLLWLAPCLWYWILGCTALLVLEMWKAASGKKRLAGMLCSALVAMLVCLTGVEILLGSNLKPNVQKLRNPEYAALSFNDYYAVGVMEQVESFIHETTGMEQSEYRVVSLGIDPAAALYHGFYCLDGYSNNYSLEYKHDFRRIIEPELEKSEYLTQNYDTWGNRCYLFSAECPGYYTIEKNGFYFQDYSLDVEALKDMGGQYLLSAAYIQNAEEAGLKLLRDMPFDTTDSYYYIYLYEVG